MPKILRSAQSDAATSQNLFEMRSEIPHYRYIDALRGVAILAVITTHCYLTSGIAKESYQILFLGQRGVQLFYIVSAFTLYASMTARKSTEKQQTINSS